MRIGHADLKYVCFAFLFLTFVFGIFPDATLSARPLCKFKEYTPGNELTETHIADFYQDNKGFIWMASRNGLCRYDGKDFLLFRSEPGNDNPQSSNRIIRLASDSRDNIWCVTHDLKLYRFNSSTSHFEDISRIVGKSYQVASKLWYPICHFPEKHVSWIALQGGGCLRFNDDDLTDFDYFLGDVSDEGGGTEERLVYGFFNDSSGREWILTNHGVYIYGQKRALSGYTFSDIREVDGRVFLVSLDGYLAEYLPQENRVKFQNFPSVVRRISCIEKLDDGMLALGTDAGLFLYNVRSAEFQLISETNDGRRIRYVSHVFADHKKNLWLYASGEGVYRISADRQKVCWYASPRVYEQTNQLEGAYVAFEDRNSTLWIKPVEGPLSWYDPETDSLRPYDEVLDHASDKSTWINFNRFFVDNQKNLWASSAHLFHFSFKSQQFEHHPEGSESEVRAVYSDGDRIWYGNKEGQLYYRDSGSEAPRYLSSTGHWSDTPVRFSSEGIYTILRDSRKSLWVGTKGDGLYRVWFQPDGSITTQHYKHDVNNSFSLSNNNVYALYEDERRHLWIGTYGGGLNVYSITGSSQRFNNRNNRLQNYPYSDYNNIRCITGARDGVILVGTTDGLISFSGIFERPAEIIFYKHSHRPTDPASLPGNDVMAVAYTSDGKALVCTYGLGVSEAQGDNLLTDSLCFDTYLNRENPGGDVSLSACLDHHDRLWIVTSRGLSCYYPAEHRFEYYDRSDFDRDYRFTEAMPAIHPSGKVVAGLFGGSLTFSYDHLRKSRFTPGVVFTGVSYTNREEIPLNDLDTLRLSADQRDFGLSFAALDFSPSSLVRYAYKMDGTEESPWTYSSAPKVNFVNLSGGTHHLQVRSTNHDGVWCDNARLLTIEIERNFWETPWSWLFYFLVFFVLITIVTYIYTYIFKLRHKMDVERKMSRLKMKYFTDISHELRTPLTLISGPISDVLAQEPLSLQARNHLELARKNTSRMLELVNQILDFRKIQTRHVRLTLSQTDIVPLLHKVKSYFDDKAREKQIRYTMDVEVESLEIWLDADKVEKIIFNLLSNAFKFTDAGKAVTISMRVTEDEVRVAVADEGRGIEPSQLNKIFERFVSLSEISEMQPSSGIGLSLVKELVHLHHAHIDVKSTPGEGTCFTVTFSRKRETYLDDALVDFVIGETEEKTRKEADEHEEVSAEKEDGTLTNKGKPQRPATILVVEDNEELRQFICSILAPTYRLREATNGKEGLDIVKREEIDFILTDLMMPEMDGMEMVRRIKADPLICHVPIVVISAKSSIDDRIEGLEHGIDDYLTKPFSATYLRSRVDNLLHQRQMLQQAFLASCLPERSDDKNGAAHVIPLSAPQVVDYDKEFVTRMMDYFEQNMSNPLLSVEDFADALNMSRTSFYRKVKSVLGMPPVDFIRKIRIRRAVQLINAGEDSLANVAYKVGFSDPKYFSKCFKRDMGMPPVEYKQKVNRSREEDNSIKNESNDME